MTNEVCPLGRFISFQYNEELHYVEPCLNGTLVQADRTNKEVGPAAGQVHHGSWHSLISPQSLLTVTLS